MIDRNFTVDHEEILRRARAEQAKAIRQMVKAVADVLFRRKAANGTVTV